MGTRTATGYIHALCTLGSLTLSLVCVAGEPHGAHGSADHAMKLMDQNKDGKVTASEHASGAEKMFAAIDKDRNGRITAEEMDAHHEKMMGDDKPARSMSSVEKIRVIDTNEDGMLSAEEHANGSREMFGKMDKDADGMLTAAEIQTGHKKMMGGG